MKICIPVNEDQGLKSSVCEHFGSAPLLMIVDSETRGFQIVKNQNLGHAHGMCQPLAALGGHDIEAIIVGGIGLGALHKLQAAGIQVFRAQEKTVEETINAYQAKTLSLVEAKNACSHGGGGGGCGHH